MVLTRTSETVPIADGKMELGTWQGIFLFEHRRAPHRRKVFVTLVGEWLQPDWKLAHHPQQQETALLTGANHIAMIIKSDGTT
jgi:hypothetical protein